MLERVKAIVPKPPPPAKSDAEVLLEAIETGAADRAQRLGDEQRQRELDHIADQQAEAIDLDNQVRILIADHRSWVATFEADLQVLAQDVAAIRANEQAIDGLRQRLQLVQQDLRGHQVMLPALSYQELDLMPMIASLLARR